MTMENNDFDIFEIIKLLLVQKWKLLGLTLMFFIALFAFQYSLPSKYNVKFTVSSTVLNQNEILLKLGQIQNFLNNKARQNLAEALDVSRSQAESIAFLDFTPVKNSTELVEIEMQASDKILLASFPEKLETFIKRDPEWLSREALKKSQLKYNLDQLNSALDSLKSIQNFDGIYIDNNEQDLINLLNKKNRFETDLTFFKLIYVYGGYEVIAMKTGALMVFLSSLLGGFTLAVALLLLIHFLKILDEKFTEV